MSNTPDLSKLDLRVVPDFPDYCVGNDGHVYSIKKRRRSYRLKETVMVHGYRMVGLYNKHGRTCYQVHRLICIAFHGFPPMGKEVRHIDGVPWNNVPKNLAWGTKVENNNDKRLHGTMPTGSNSRIPHLTKLEIYTRYVNEGVSQFRLSELYGCSVNAVHKIIKKLKNNG